MIAPLPLPLDIDVFTSVIAALFLASTYLRSFELYNAAIHASGVAPVILPKLPHARMLLIQQQQPSFSSTQQAGVLLCTCLLLAALDAEPLPPLQTLARTHRLGIAQHLAASMPQQRWLQLNLPPLCASAASSSTAPAGAC